MTNAEEKTVTEAITAVGRHAEANISKLAAASNGLAADFVAELTKARRTNVDLVKVAWRLADQVGKYKTLYESQARRSAALAEQMRHDASGD